MTEEGGAWIAKTFLDFYLYFDDSVGGVGSRTLITLADGLI